MTNQDEVLKVEIDEIPDVASNEKYYSKPAEVVVLQIEPVNLSWAHSFG
jgi:hypothetical protein